MSKIRDVLFVVNSANHGAYSRHNWLRKAHRDWSIDHIWLDKPIFVTFNTRTLIRQARKSFIPANYQLIIYWPASYQYFRTRLGSSYFEDHGEYEQRCWAVAEEALFAGLDEHMLNSFVSSRTAANKAMLFKLAAELGLATPRTIITNDLRSLSMSNKVHFIVKSVTDTNDIDEEKKIFPVRLSSRPSPSELSAQPVIVQEEIHAKHEYRTYFFAGKIIIICISRVGLRDIDVRLRSGDFLPCSIVANAELRRKTLKLAHHFGLGMFSADFIADKKGRFLLLDLNPHGSWHWLDPKVALRLDLEFEAMIANRLSH